MREVEFIGRSREDLRAFPDTAREQAGRQLWFIQTGSNPADWKPMTSVGAGAREIRIRDTTEPTVSSTSQSSKMPSTSSTASKRKLRKPARQTSTSHRPATKKLQLDPEDLIIGPYETVWDAIEDDPTERERMIVLANLSIAVELEIRKRGWTQKQAAKHLGVTQPRICDLVRGKLSVVSIDALVGMLGAAGVRVDLSYRPVPPPPATKRERAAA